MKRVRISIVLFILLISNFYYFQGTNFFTFDRQKINDEKLLSMQRVSKLASNSTFIQSTKEQEQLAAKELNDNIAETLNGFNRGFLENNGQKNDEIFYYTENSQMGVGFGLSEIRFSIINPDEEYLEQQNGLIEEQEIGNVDYTTFALEFLNSKKVVPVAEDPTGTFNNYLIGSDEAQWVFSSQYYSKIVYYDIYDKIDLFYELKDGQLKYEFFVHPGGEYEDINLHWTGPVTLDILTEGMEVKVKLNRKSSKEFSFVDTNPVNYQSINRKKEIEGKFRIINKETYGFDIIDYNPNELLIIDPVFDPIYIDSNDDFGSTGYDFPGYGNKSHPFLIEDLTITNSTEDLIEIRNTNVYFIIRNCTLNGISGNNYGIYLHTVENGEINNNTAYNNSRGFHLNQACNNTLTNNTGYDNDYGFYLTASSDNNTLTNNTAYSNGEWGFILNLVSFNTLTNNIAYNNTNRGFYLVGSNNNTLTNNTAYDNQYGFCLDILPSNNNTLTNNKAYNNTIGFYLRSSSNNNTLTGNKAYNNTNYGIYISSSNNNSVKWNKFINNNPSGSSQAYDDLTSNIFSFNYWDDHTTPDVNSDGIVDSAYSIDGGSNTDPYPLTYPWTAHDPIDINSNSDFEALGFLGEGTASNPYVIESYYINDSTTNLIDISNTDAHFIIRNCNLDGVTGSNYGIYLDNVQNGTIENSNKIRRTSGGIYLYFCQNNTVTDNYITNNTGNSIYLYNSSFNVLSSNWVFNNTGNSIRLSTSCQNNTITGNNIYNNTAWYYHGIFLENFCQNNSLSDNHIYNNTYIPGSNSYGIYLEFCQNNNVTDNYITNNTGNGIYLYNSSFNVLSSNWIFNNTGDSISLSTSCQNNTITDNTIYNNNAYGIHLDFSSNNTLSSNTIYNNNYDGIVLSNSHNNTLSSNTINDNSWNGIRLFSSSNNTISSNRIYDNSQYGNYLESSSNDNIVSWNTFIGNNAGGTQAYDDSTSNIFTFNYWDDHTGSDANNDGIYDNSYSILGAASNTDPYPLTYPWTAHDPIDINSNSDFEALGFLGEGTASKPYVIEDYYINDTTFALIDISNTDAYFIIRNCRLNGITGSNYGIYLDNVTNGQISNNQIENCDWGIHLLDSDNHTIIENYVSFSTTYGMIIYTSDKNLVHNNTIWNSTDTGMYIFGSDLNNFTFNRVYNCSNRGFEIRSSENNLLMNNYAYGNLDSGTSSGFGTYENNYNNTFKNNFAYNNHFGFSFYNGEKSDNIYVNNSVYDNYNGFNIWATGGNIVNNSFINNKVFNNTYRGFYVSTACDNNEFINNFVYNNGNDGFSLSNSDNNSFINNYIAENGAYGIDIASTSSDTNVSWNAFINNNINHANDDGTNNKFTFNYWDDHTGSDVNNDGIYDNSYANIDGSANTNDSYPLNYPYRPHEPIYINENADFIILGFPGEGTISDPYIIKDYFIRNSTFHLIRIINTTAFFTIQNCLLNGLNGGYDGIALNNVTNGTITDNILSNSKSGLILDSSNNNTLTYNIVFNIENDGISLRRSDNNTISYSTVFNNSKHGIILENSSLNNLFSNLIYNNSESGISLRYSNSTIVFNNTIYDTNQGGLKLNSSYYNVLSQNTIFNHTHSTYSEALSLSYSANNTVSNNNLFNNIVGLFLMYSSNNNNISSNTISGNALAGIILYTSCNNNILSNNTLFNNFQMGIELYISCNNNSLHNNTIYGNNDPMYGMGIFILESNDNYITNNVIFNNSYGIVLNSSINNLARNNTIYINSKDGIWLKNASDNNVSTNLIYDNVYHGIYLNETSNQNFISGNSIYNNSHIRPSGGIGLVSSENNTISHNTIYDNSNDGIYLLSASNNNTIKNNIIHDNFYDGIFLNASTNNSIFLNELYNNSYGGITLHDYTYYNVILNNTISTNIQYGIGLSSLSGSNIIKWNDFIDNEKPTGTQASDDGSNNKFEYNYWNDLTGPDTSPPYGIVDDPYSIDGTAVNFDLFPLAKSSIHFLLDLQLIYPNGGDIIEELLLIQWISATDSLNHNITYALYYSSDNGFNWILIVAGLTNTSISWDTTSAANGVNYLIRVNATCSQNLWAIDDSNSVFSIYNVFSEPDPPIIIVYQVDISIHELSTGNNLSWTVIDSYPDTYSIWRNTTTSVVTDDPWLNNTAILVSIDGLDPGIYNFTAEFKDSNGNSVRDEVWVTINKNTAPEVTVNSPNGGERLSGEITITWSAIDDFNLSLLIYVVEYWNGYSWINLADSLTTTTYRWNTESVVDRSDYKIRVNASDGYLTGGDNSDSTFAIDNDPTFEQIPTGQTEFQVTIYITVAINVSAEVNVTIEIVTEVTVSPPEDADPLGIYLDITASDPNVVEGLWINVTFDELGTVDPTNARIYYYHEDDETWYPVKETNVDFDNEVVWGWASHLTLFGVMDVRVQTPPLDPVPLLIFIFLILVPVTVISLFIYRRTRKRIRLQKVKKEVRKAKIDLGLLKDFESD